MINRSLYWKIALAFVLVAFITAALVAVFIRATSPARLSRLVIDQQRETLLAILTDYYQANGSWENLPRDWQNLQRAQLSAGTGGMMNGGDMGEHMAGMESRSLYGLADAEGRVLVPVGAFNRVGQKLTARQLRQGTAIEVDGQNVGVLLTVDNLPVYNAAERLFLTRTNQALLWGMVGAVIVALAIGLVLARNLTQPLRELTTAAQNIASGQLEQQVEVKTEDEIGQLGAAFNSMSREVARVNQQRRQMTADIAHDLRTPLTVIAGYIESMREGVLAPTEERLDLIYSEIVRLQKMVTDLRMLSQVDAGELTLDPQPMAPDALLRRTVERFRHQADQQEVSLEAQIGENLPMLRLDEARMQQVMDNLLSNALRYTPPGGIITLTANKRSNGVEICVSDTGSGIAADELPYVFDRFRRGDKSRHAEGDESGLGLAIVRALVEAHGGSASAASTPGQGTTIRMLFPAAE